MTITYGAHGRIVEFDLDTTVGINLPQPDPSLAHTVRITPPYRRPAATSEQPPYRPSWSFGSVVDSPALTEDLPPYAAYANREREHVGRHRQRRTWRTVLAAVLCRLAAAITSGGAR